jgi:hypothetical protein
LGVEVTDPYTCAKMVLDYLGIANSYDQLVQMLGIGPAGVPFRNLHHLQTLGATVLIERGSLLTLEDHLSQALPAIAFVDTGWLSYWSEQTQHAVAGRGLMGVWTGIALVDKDDLDGVAGHLLDLLSQVSHLSPLLFIGRGDMQSQQVAQGINRHVNFTALFAFMAVIAGATATFRGRLQRPAIQNRGRGLGLSTGGQPQQRSQIVYHGGKSCGIMRQAVPARTSQRKPLNTSRNASTRCGASSRIKVKYGTTNAHSSSVTSVGYAFLSILLAYPPCQI